jgi:hypothetical protein
MAVSPVVSHRLNTDTVRGAKWRDLPRLRRVNSDVSFSVPRPFLVEFTDQRCIAIIFDTMHARRITYNELSELTGIHWDTIRRWRTKRRSPRVSLLMKCYHALGIRFVVWAP